MNRVSSGVGSHLLPLFLAIAAIGLGASVAFSLLSTNEWDPSVFIKFPAAKPVELAYGNEVLGDVVPSAGFGHDGKFFFMQAMDPFYLTPDAHAAFLDRPSYRAQRMLYPTLAGGFGMFPPQGTAWGLLIVNLLGLGVGTWLTALLARELGLSAWFGLAFLFNPGVLVSSFIDTAEVLAMLFLVAGALFLLRDRVTISAVFLTLAVLSRETMILAVIGAIAYCWHTKRSVPKVLGLPFVVGGLWWVYLRARLGYLDNGVQDTQAIGAPFKGFYEAMEIWLTEPGSEVDLAIGALLLLISLLVAWRAVTDRNLLALMTAGFALLAVLMVEGVWRFYFDASRALVPVITVYLLMVPVSIKSAKQAPRGTDAMAVPRSRSSGN